MTKLTVFLFLLIPTLCWGQTKAEDYWVYIKDRTEIVSSDRIAGTSQKGDIVEVIPCSRLGKFEPSELEKKEWLIIKVSGITEAERNAMLAPYTETKTVNGREVIETIAYRRRKIDVDAYKTEHGINNKTSFVTTVVSKNALVTNEKTTTDISDMQKEAKLYDRLMPVRKLAKWGWEKILAPAYAANTTHTVITTGGGDYTTLNAYEDAIDGTSYSAGETATVNCSGTDADTTAVTFAGWDADVTIIVNGDYAVTSGVHWSTDYYRLTIGNVALTIGDGAENIKLNKLQVSVSSGYDRGIYFTASGSLNATIDRCIVRASTAGTGQMGIYIDDGSGGTITIRNTIVYDFTGTNGDGIVLNDADVTINCYNVTSTNHARRGISNVNGTINATNCAVFNNTDDFLNVTCDYCASDDADGTNHVHLNENAGSEWTNAFVDYTNKDFHVKDTSSAVYNTGTDLFGSGVTTDIDGASLTVRNDIGADEYVASGATPRRRIIIISKHENNHTTSYTDDYTSRLGICPKREEENYA